MPTQELAGQEQADRLHRSIERGGLPKEAEAEAIYLALRQAFDLIERLAYRVTPIASADWSEIDEPITLEQIGLVSLIVVDARRSLADIGKEVTHLEDALWNLGAIRDEQLRARSEDRPSDAS